jgi:hypothetical protein
MSVNRAILINVEEKNLRRHKAYDRLCLDGSLRAPIIESEEVQQSDAVEERTQEDVGGSIPEFENETIVSVVPEVEPVAVEEILVQEPVAVEEILVQETVAADDCAVPAFIEEQHKVTGVVADSTAVGKRKNAIKKTKRSVKRRTDH